MIGRGKGSRYQSWLKNGDFSSKGRSSRVKSTKVNRIHHTFSNLETDFLYKLLWDVSISGSVRSINDKYATYRHGWRAGQRLY